MFTVARSSAAIIFVSFFTGLVNNRSLAVLTVKIQTHMHYCLAAGEVKVILRDYIHSQDKEVICIQEAGKELRDYLSDYFMSPDGEVPWQYNMI